MIARLSSIALGLGLAFAGLARAQAPEKADPSKAEMPKADPSKADAPKADPSKAEAKKAEAPRVPRTETATLGGGCFWCSEAVFERLPGVRSVVSGYSGGLVPNPTYQMVCTGQTGHAEVVQIEFDPDRISFEDLLHVFFKTHDPTTPDSQGPDFGTQYRSIILYRTAAQKATAQKVYRELTAKRAFRGRIVTELVPFVAFFPAEPYHQDYYRNHPFEEYSLTYIEPKVYKVQAMLAPPAAAKGKARAKAAAKKP